MVRISYCSCVESMHYNLPPLNFSVSRVAEKSCIALLVFGTDVVNIEVV